MIKKLTTILTIAIVSLFALPEKAEAGSRKHSYVSAGHASCGCAVYKQRYVRYYDDCGYPVYGYRKVAVRHTCSAYRSRNSRYHSNNRYYDRGSRYKNRRYNNYRSGSYDYPRYRRGSRISVRF